MTAPSPKPVLIIGAGISGLLLAQSLLGEGVPFRIFERDPDLDARSGLGWGLTFHWSLDALKALLPGGLVARLPEAYVDRLAVVERGEVSTFPFFDLHTGEMKGASPRAGENQRIRVSRKGVRDLMATGLDVEYGKSFHSYSVLPDGQVIVSFDDGSSAEGRLLVACDGGRSRIRRALFPEDQCPSPYQLPVRVMGLKTDFSAEVFNPARKLDAFFLQGASSADDTFMYLSVLDAPGNRAESSPDKYNVQMVISWPYRQGFRGSSSPTDFPSTRSASVALIKEFATTSWADPFRSLIQAIPDDTDVQHLILYDWPPPKGLRGKGPVVLMGDALHPMTMYRGEGANHTVIDVSDFAELVTPHLLPSSGVEDLRPALDAYEDAVVERARPAVLASRKACLDAHDWTKLEALGGQSPLLSRRQMRLGFEEEDCWK